MKKLLPKKATVIKYSLFFLLGVLLYLVTAFVYNKREVLTFALTNETKVQWLIEANKQATADADNKVKEGLSRVFIKE